MTRRKFVMRDGELVEVDPATYVPKERSVSTRYVSDAWMDGTRSPIDGADIGSRTKLREHMRARDVVDHAEAVQEARIQRQRRAQEFERARKQDLIDSLQRIRAGHRPNVKEYKE